jgi:hypothetical protein
MRTVGKGQYEYEIIEKWGSFPSGWNFVPVSAIAADSHDRIYAFQRKDPPALIFVRAQALTPAGATSWRRTMITHCGSRT